MALSGHEIALEGLATTTGAPATYARTSFRVERLIVTFNG
jgi:hypothetical protein